VQVDAYHSNFKELQTVRRMEAPLASGLGWTGATLSTAGPIEGNRMASGTFTHVPFLVVENYNNDRHAKLDSLGLNVDYKLADKWNLNTDLSWSKVKRTDLRLESTAGTGTRNDSTFPPAEDTISWTTNADGVTFPHSSLNYGNYNTVFLTDPGGWGGGPRRSGFLGNPTVNDEIKAIKIGATHELSSSLAKAFSFGVNYAERTKSKYQWQSILYLPAGVSHAVVPTAYRTGVIDTSFFGNPNGMISYDSYGLLKSGFWTTIDSRVDTNAGGDDRKFDITGTWSLKEKLTTLYFKLDLDTQLFGRALTGNIGVQTQTADQSADLGFTSGVDPVTKVLNATVVTRGAKYTDVLPSLNLNLALPSDVQLRFAAAVSVARPRMDDMAGGASFTTVANSAPAIAYGGKDYYWQQNGGGNPELKPWKANSFDVSLEKYFSNKGYLSAAVYYKSLTSYIFKQTTFVDFTGILLPDQVKASDPTAYTFAAANRAGVRSVLTNGHGGSIKGLELTASLPWDTFTPTLEGFGMILSAAWNRSAINPTGLLEEPLPGLSPKVINTTLYYEKHGFSARVSNRYRGEFVGEVPKFDSSLEKNTVKSESLVDAQIGYEFSEGAVKGLTLNLSGTNLTDAPFVLYPVGAQPRDIVKYEKYGAVYALSASYKF
jgi:iron complex outermembrane receptor protein